MSNNRPPDRRPPRPTFIPRHDFDPLPPEGYAGGASPSMDVSNTAGTGGASSRRGYGRTNTGASMYWYPDPDDQIPR
jgi:hypothetical protein